MADPITSTFVLLRSVLDIVVDYYDDNSISLPARRYVCAGLPAVDCEQITVRGARRYSHTGDMLREEPTSVLGLAQVGIPVEVQIVRCAVTLDDNGAAPLPSEMEADAAVLYSDSDHVLNAIREAVGAGLLGGCHTVAWLDWRNDGEDGGLMAGTTTFALSLQF